MAEQVNQRIEDMINQLEQMRRTNLFNDEEIREISRKRKEFEYRIQRRVKEKDDFVHYIAYELALLEDISLRRKLAKLGEKKKDIEYAIAKHVNKVFKQFIYRFQNDLEVYFQYIKFCKNVGFEYAISGVIGQMLQVHGEKPKMWQLASKWESEDQNNPENARSFLLKGIHRHPESDILYLELFKIELALLCKVESEEEKEKQFKRVNVIWKNGMNSVNNIKFLFELYDLCMKFDVAESIANEIKTEIWSQRENREVWPYIACKELQGCHWQQIEDFLDDEHNFPKPINNYIGVFEEALQQFPDKTLCTQYIHGLLGLDENVYSGNQKINIVKHAWMYGHENGLLADDMYVFGIEMLKIENVATTEELMEILDTAVIRNPEARELWEEKLLLSKSKDEKILGVLQDASKYLKSNDNLHLWNLALDNIESDVTIKNLYNRLQNCESTIILALKPKFLQKIYRCKGLKGARQMYEESICTPPTQVELHTVMIEIEKSQDKPNVKNIRKCFECLVQHHGKDKIDVWTNYMKFETENSNAQAVPAIYRRAVATLKKDLVDEFIKYQTLAKLK